MTVEVLRQDPPIVRIRGFVSREEAAHLVSAAEGHFSRSNVVCDKPEGCISSHRTSTTAYLGKDLVARSVMRRGLKFSGLPSAEDLQIVRYFAGQEFKPHLDAFDIRSEGGRRELAKFGGMQRDATCLIYLNEGMDGGETVFPKIGLGVRPILGSAIYWKNLKPDGSVDDRVFHGGAPVSSGIKYAANLWMRGNGTVKTMPSLGSLRQALGFGDFRPSLETDAKQFGMRVERREYPMGIAGVRLGLEKIAQYIREGMTAPSMRAFAEMVVRKAGVAPKVQISDRQAAQILLDYVRENVRYRADPDQTEYVQIAAITLCLPGAPMCIPVGDCDDLVVALGSLMGAYGIPVKVMKQTFSGGGSQEHVLIVVQIDGRWMGADACAPGKPLGWRAPASKEAVVDPMDPKSIGLVDAPEGQFVGVGRLPIGPGDVLAYRRMWDPYVTGMARAALSCSGAWTQGPFPPTSGGVTPQNIANGESLIAESIMTEWNAFANIPDWQLVASAPEILSYFQSIVLRVGNLYAPQIKRDCPAILLPSPAAFDAQVYVVAQLEALGVIAHGVLQILGIGASGTLQTYAQGGEAVAAAVKTIADTAANVANQAANHLGWIAAAVIAVSATVVAVEFGPEILALFKAEQTFRHSSREARRLVARR